MSADNWTKQPSEVLDFYFDFSVWLTSVGETSLESAVVTVAPTGLDLDDSGIVSSTRVQMWFSGGSNGTAYKVTCVGTTPGGRTKEYENWLVVRDT